MRFLLAMLAVAFMAVFHLSSCITIYPANPWQHQPPMPPQLPLPLPPPPPPPTNGDGEEDSEDGRGLFRAMSACRRCFGINGMNGINGGSNGYGKSWGIDIRNPYGG